MKDFFSDINFKDLILGTLVALLLWFLDKMKRPHLNIYPGESSNINLPQGKYKILNLKVGNKRKFFFNQTATQVRVILKFKDYFSQKELFSLISRWNTTKEPLTPDYSKVDVGLALTNPREVIAPGENLSLSVAIKKEKCPKCYAFNNESYLHSPDFAKSEWEINDDKFIITAAIQSAEIEYKEKSFIVINKSMLSQFLIS